MTRSLHAAAVCFALLGASANAQTPPTDGVIDAGSEDRILVHFEEFDASVGELWSLYTKSEDVARWMAPVAQVDLRAGGSIRTHYDPCSNIGDAGTITLNILAYVPEKRLFLQADLKPQREASWMNPVVYENRDRLYNLIEFEALEGGRTRIVSWGLGYGQSEEWATMISFFEQGNAYSYGQLRSALAGEDVWPTCDKETE